MAQTPYLSVVCPCFNEEQVLNEFYRRTKSACEATARSYEIVLVNDGSKDATGQLMDDLARRDKHVVAIHLSRNHGQQLALTAGLSLCRGDNIFVIDADLQDPPELLAPFLRQREAGADVVYGQRRRRAGETWFKRTTAYFFYRFLNAFTDVSIPRDTGDFRLMSRRVVDHLLAMPEKNRFVRGMVSWVGFKQEAFPYDRDPRLAGESKYPFRRMLSLATDAITSFSVKPLKISYYFALLFGLLAFISTIFAGFLWVAGSSIATVAAIVAILCLFNSLQMGVIAIQGEYLGRLYEEGKNRPLFIVERAVNVDAKSVDISLERQAA